MDDCANYLLNYAPYLHYDKALAEGVPIASGVIEGTCRHLVEDGMNITGARWGLAGAEAVLRLRPSAPVMTSMPIGNFTNNRNTNATTHRTTPIIMCRKLSRPRASYLNPAVAAP